MYIVFNIKNKEFCIPTSLTLTDLTIREGKIVTTAEFDFRIKRSVENSTATPSKKNSMFTCVSLSQYSLIDEEGTSFEPESKSIVNNNVENSIENTAENNVTLREIYFQGLESMTIASGDCLETLYYDLSFIKKLEQEIETRINSILFEYRSNLDKSVKELLEV